MRSLIQVVLWMAVLNIQVVGQVKSVPTIDHLTPDSTSPGAGELKLTVVGTGFVSGSIVQLNGTQVPTSFTSDSQLLATVPSSFTATAGTAYVTVANPGGSTAVAKQLVIELSIFDKSHLNLLMSTVVLLAGLAVYWLWHPPIFHEHTFVERAFEFWVLKWIAYAAIWGLVTALTDLRFVLATDDLNTIIGFGFVIAMWKGDSYDERHSAVNLVFLFGLLFAWNFIMFPSPGAPDADLPYRDGMRWVFPSMTASLVLIASMGVVTIIRCGSAAIPFAVAIGAYCFLQLPTYEVVYRIGKNPQSYGELVKYLAFGKLLCGGLFYTLFPQSVKKFDAVHVAFPNSSWSTTGLRKGVVWAAGTVGAAVVTAVIDFLARRVL